MPKDDDLYSLGEFSIGGQGIPQPKYIAPIVRNVTFGLVDDTPNYEYAELIPEIPAKDGYFPSMGPEGVISGVPSEAITTADVIGGITDEVVGGFVFGGLGTLIGAAFKPAVKKAGVMIRKASKDSVRAPIGQTSKGYNIWKGVNEGGDTIYTVTAPDWRGRIKGQTGPNSPEGFIDINTIWVDHEARGGPTKYDLYNGLLEVAQKDGLEGIASAPSKRTSVKTDRWWFDNTEGRIKGKGHFSHLDYDTLTRPVQRPVTPENFSIQPVTEKNKNPMLVGNMLMELKEVKGVVPLRKLAGTDRYAPIREGMVDSIDGWLMLGEKNLVRVPDPKAEGLTKIDIRPGKIEFLDDKTLPDIQRPPSRGVNVTTDTPVESVKIHDIETIFDEMIDPDTNKVKGRDRWSLLEPSQDPRIDDASWGLGIDYEGYVESGGDDFKAIIEPVWDLSKDDIDYGYYRLKLADGTAENFTSIEEAMDFAEKTKKFNN